MATIAKGPIELYNRESGRWVIRRYKVDAAATFKRGGVLVLDADGELTEGGADPTNIVGIAEAAAADKDADGKIPVAIPLDGAYFVVNIGGTGVTAQTDLLKGYGIVKEGDNWHVDKTDTTNKRVVIEDFDRRDAMGDTNGRVVCSFVRSVLARNAGL
jgi:hypothetical protein